MILPADSAGHLRFVLDSELQYVFRYLDLATIESSNALEHVSCDFSSDTLDRHSRDTAKQNKKSNGHGVGAAMGCSRAPPGSCRSKGSTFPHLSR